MMKLAKINKKLLLDNISSSTNRRESDHIMEFIARAYLYLDEVDKYYLYMNKAIVLCDENIIDYQNRIKQEQKNPSHYMIAGKYLRKADLLRIVCKKEESIKYFQLAKEFYLKSLPEKFEDSDLDMEGETVLYLSECYYFLGEYEKSMKVCNYLLPSQKERSISYYLSDYVLNNKSPEYLEKVFNLIKKFSRGIPIGCDSGCTVAIWDWYEICLQLAYMPSKLDEIQQYVDSLDNSEN